MVRALVIGDAHEPVAHVGYLDFCSDIGHKWKCDTVVSIGDLFDWHGISFHPKDPHCPGPSAEYIATKEKVKRWKTRFKKYKRKYICIGNHDERPEVLAKSVNIPSELLKDYAEVWGMSDWKWDYDFILDDVYYCHGTGQSGIHPAWNLSGKMLMSVVMGHCHSRAGIKWRVNPIRRIFAMDTGCGIDVKAYQFLYGKHVKERPVLGCGVVLDGTPYHEIMPISPGEKYAKEKYPSTE